MIKKSKKMSLLKFLKENKNTVNERIDVQVYNYLPKKKLILKEKYYMGKIRGNVLRILIVIIVLSVFFCDGVLAQGTTLADLELRSTYEAISVRTSFSGDAISEDDVMLEYKRQDSIEWKEGHPLAIIPTNRLMGSIFYLEENTLYDIRVRINGCSAPNCVKEGSVSTLSGNFPTGSGNGYYVSTSGDDNNLGTSSQPFQTIQKAANVAQAGDVVHIQPGIYHEEIKIKNSGNENAYILFKAEGDVKLFGSISELEVIDGNDDWIYDPDSNSYKTNIEFETGHVSYSNQRLFRYSQRKYTFENFINEIFKVDGVEGSYWSDVDGTLYVKIPGGSDPDTHEMHVANQNVGIKIISKSYIIIDGLEIAYFGRGSSGKGIFIKNSENIIVRNCLLHNLRDHINIGGINSYNNLIEDNEIYDTSITSWAWDKNKKHDTEGGGVRMAGGGGNVIRRNVIYGTFNGIPASTFWSDEDLRDESYNYNCDIYDNFIYDVSDDGIEPEGAHINFRIWNNTLKNVNHPISLAPITVGPTYVFRNKMLNAFRSPIKYSNEYKGRVYLYHNSGFALGENNSGIYASGSFGNTISRNNIFYGNKYAFDCNYVIYKTVDFDYDCLYTTKTSPQYNDKWIRWSTKRYSDIEQFRSSTGHELNGLDQDPLYEDINNYNINLQESSPCIDAGVLIPNINDWNYLGSAPDIGAIEFDSSIPQCTEICKPNQCNTYDNCGSLVGTCASGYCCSGSCTTQSICGQADNNPIDGVIEITELMNYISQWKIGSVTITELTQAIGYWKNGCS